MLFRTGSAILCCLIVLPPASADPIEGFRGAIRDAADRKARENDLKGLFVAHLKYQNDNDGKGPSGPENLRPYLAKLLPRAYERLKAGKYILIWNVDDDLDGGMDNCVLGYEVEVPTKGGFVVINTGKIKAMTANEFREAPKAQPTKVEKGAKP
jgi:hypothetical protein